MTGEGYMLLQPEVAGGLGERTVMDTTLTPPRVKRLHYEFEGWLGDDLLESYPVFVLTRVMGERLRKAGLRGFTLREVDVSRSEVFEELHPQRELPAFEWLDVDGSPGGDDLGLDPQARLVASSRAMGVLRTGSLEQCLVSAWPPA